MSCGFAAELARALGVETLSGSDEIGIVREGVLYRTTVDYLATYLGVGGLTNVGENSATPLLGGTSPDQTIAKLLGTQGIRVQKTAGGAVAIAAQLKDAGTSANGAALIKNRTAETIEFRRIKAGSGIRVTQAGDSVVIENSDTALANNTVVVASLNDLPVPASGVITLSQGTDYLFVNPITTTHRFVLPDNCVIRSVDAGFNALTYNGTGAMFTLLDGYQAVRNISLSCPNGTLLDDTSDTGVFVMENVSIEQVKDLGDLAKASIGLFSVLIGLHTGAGFLFASVAGRRLIMERIIVSQSTGAGSTFMDLGTATFSVLNIDSVTFSDTLSGQTFLKGAATSGNLPAQAVAFVSRVSITGDMAALNTVTPNDAGWEFEQCNKIATVDPHGLTYLTAAATTTIATLGVPVAATGTFAQKAAQKCSTNAAGEITYNGKQPRFLRLNATVSVEPASGTNKLIRLVLAKNGVVDTTSAMTRVCSAGATGLLSIDWGVEAVTGDVFRIYVANDTDTIGVKLNQAALRVS